MSGPTAMPGLARLIGWLPYVCQRGRGRVVGGRWSRTRNRLAGLPAKLLIEPIRIKSVAYEDVVDRFKPMRVSQMPQ